MERRASIIAQVRCLWPLQLGWYLLLTAAAVVVLVVLEIFLCYAGLLTAKLAACCSTRTGNTGTSRLDRVSNRADQHKRA